MTTDPYSQDHSPYLAMGNNPIRLLDTDGGVATDPNGNIIFTVTSKSMQKIQSFEVDPNTGITTVLWFYATEGKILTDAGNEVTAYRANSSTVYVTQLSSDGNVLGVAAYPADKIDNSYNCTGNAFTNQKFTIGSDLINDQYLVDEGYMTLREFQTPRVGDVGIYVNKDGTITHLEPFITNTHVSTKGGVAVDNGLTSSGQNKQFLKNGATYKFIRKTQPNQVVNLPSNNNNTGVREVDAATFEQTQKELQGN